MAEMTLRLRCDPQTGKTDENMLKKSIEQFKVIVDKDKNDQESRLILARLYNWAHNSVDAEKTYKSILEVEPDNEEALTGLANVYAGIGDTNGSVAGAICASMMAFACSIVPSPYVTSRSTLVNCVPSSAT